MVNVAFIVEGESEELLIKSNLFQEWAGRNGVTICRSVINARGGGNLCPENYSRHLQDCQTQCRPDRIIVLTDLECDPCFTQARERIGAEGIDLICIARKTLECWFLADSQAMGSWLGRPFALERPEEIAGDPWEYVKTLRTETGRGPGRTHLRFAHVMLKNGFSIERAAAHPHCPSARYFVERLRALAS